MKNTMTGDLRICVRMLLGTALLLFCTFYFIQNTVAKTGDPFVDLRGNWKGSGLMTLKDGSRYRLACTSEFTGSATQLVLAINCTSSFNKIEMSAKLSKFAGYLRGVWEENTYRALGTISGKISENKISFKIAGNMWGRMTVSYSRRQQKIFIKTRGIPLETVKINMRRR